MDFNKVILALPAFLEGLQKTVVLTLVAVFFGLLLGLLLALARISKAKPLNYFAKFYIWLFRGTPLLLQIFFIYYGLPTMPEPFAIKIAQYPAAFIALSLNSGAYLAEIIRAAIQSIDKGQMEASKALGMSYTQAMKRIVIPQSYRRLIPPVGNEIIALLKDSSLVSAIAITELMRTTTLLANSSGSAIYYLPCAVLYLCVTSLFTYVFGRLEKRYSVYE